MLLDQLTAKQTALGLSDGRFAKLLGVSKATWRKTRAQEMPIRWAIASAAARTFPDLVLDTAMYLRTAV